MEDATDTSEDSPVTREKRHRVEELPKAAGAGKEVLKTHVHWRDPVSAEGSLGFDPGPPLEGVGAAITGWAVDHCRTSLHQEFSAAQEKSHGNVVRAAKERELAPWRKFKVFDPATEGTSP